MPAPSLIIRSGSRGKFVRELQGVLNARRPIGSAPLAVDGVCGPATLTAASRALGRPAVGPLDRADLARLGVDIVLLADLSGHNEGGNKRPVDPDLMAHDGVYGCWFKGTEGTSYVNREAKRQIDAAGHVMRRGGYHFADPSIDRRDFDVVALDADARAEASHYLRWRGDAFGGTGPELPDLIDFERGISQRIGRQLLALAWTTARKHEANALWALALLGIVEQATGRRPWRYLPLWAFNAYFAKAPKHLLDAFAGYRNVVASYNGGAGPERIPPGSEDFGAWQCTGSGSIDGVDGRVDLSWALRKDLAHG